MVKNKEEVLLVQDEDIWRKRQKEYSGESIVEDGR